MMATSLCRSPRPPLQTALFLYASGRTTDIVTDSGDSLSHTVPIHEAGRDPAECLMKRSSLSEDTLFTATAERELAWDVTERHISVDHDIAQIDCGY